MKEKIIAIIGFGMEPERAELMADEIMELFYTTAFSKFDHCDTCGKSELIEKGYYNCCGAKQIKL